MSEYIDWNNDVKTWKWRNLMILTIASKVLKMVFFLGSPGSSKNGSWMRAIVMFDVDAIGAMKSCCVQQCEKVMSIEKVWSERSKREGPKVRAKMGCTNACSGVPWACLKFVAEFGRVGQSVTSVLCWCAYDQCVATVLCVVWACGNTGRGEQMRVTGLSAVGAAESGSLMSVCLCTCSFDFWKV